MSEMSERARARAKAKAERLVKPNSGAIDASGWREPLGELGEVQTGPRPVSRQTFRRGGKVDGAKGAMRADRRPRKAGGSLTADSLINRDVKEANEKRVGEKHVGGMKRGGRAHKAVGGPMTPQQLLQLGQSPNGMKRGGRAHRDMGGLALPNWADAVSRKSGGKVHADEAQDRKLIHDMGCKCGKCSGGRVGRASGGGNWIAGAIKHPGALHKELHVPQGEKIPAKKLAKAANSDNPKLAKRAHLAETLKKMHKASGGSATYADTRPAGGRLARKGGGRAKKGMNVNIIIAPSQPKAAMPPPGLSPPPGVGPVGLHQAPPPMPPPGAAPPMGPPPGAMPAARKDGGRLSGRQPAYPIKDGAGGAKGRLEKIAAYG